MNLLHFPYLFFAASRLCIKLFGFLPVAATPEFKFLPPPTPPLPPPRFSALCVVPPLQSRSWK
jgi:hypothetical protein